MLTEILSPASGTVWKIEVSVGDEVANGDAFLIMELMKMEIPVCAEADCVVMELRCNEGDSLEERQVILVVEEK